MKKETRKFVRSSVALLQLNNPGLHHTRECVFIIKLPTLIVHSDATNSLKQSRSYTYNCQYQLQKVQLFYVVLSSPPNCTFVLSKYQIVEPSNQL